MIPNIFISSTIKDLKYLRDILRKTIHELGYFPIMSDYGEIGYLPSVSVEESCYMAIKDCQLVIVIIGKNYGSAGRNGYGITHNEYLKAKEEKIPIIFLVDKEVLILQKVFQQNPESTINLPDIDKPDLLFSLIDDFKNSEQNNGFLTFTESTDISHLLKQQIALIFGDLLKARGEQERNRLKDIYADISTIKHYLLDSNPQKQQLSEIKTYSKFFRFLLEKRNSELKFTLDQVFGSIEDSYTPVLESTEFNELISKFEISFEINDNEVTVQNSNLGYLVEFGFTGVSGVDDTNYINKYLSDTTDTSKGIIWAGKGKIKTNRKGNIYLENSFKELKTHTR